MIKWEYRAKFRYVWTHLEALLLSWSKRIHDSSPDVKWEVTDTTDDPQSHHSFYQHSISF